MNDGNGGDAGELTLADRRVLATTIDPRHLAPEAIARVRKAMDAHPNRHAVIDDVLLPAHLEPLRELVAGDRAFDPNL